MSVASASASELFGSPCSASVWGIATTCRSRRASRSGSWLYDELETDGRDARRRRVTGILTEVAQRLNAHDWTGILPVGEDFVVYWTDVNLYKVRAGLEASVPADRLARLEAQGLLPTSRPEPVGAGEDLADLLKELRRELPERIAAAITAQPPGEPAFCIALRYAGDAPSRRW